MCDCHCVADYVQLITYFGLNGNGLDRITRRLGQRNLNVQCGSGTQGVTITWLHSNGTAVSTSDKYLRQGKNADGIVLLQIAIGRGIDYCDAGVYICKAVLPMEGQGTEVVQTRNLSVRVESKCLNCSRLGLARHVEFSGMQITVAPDSSFLCIITGYLQHPHPVPPCPTALLWATPGSTLAGMSLPVMGVMGSQSLC